MSPVAGEGWLQLGELALAFVLSALVGVEREIRRKNAGLRTHTLVGVSSALIMLVSKYGFMDVLATGQVVVDPSRVAAQIVTGIGFIGGGVIFMRRDTVRGLTTAASIWFTAALGMACGAGLTLLGLATIAAYFIVMSGFPYLEERLPRPRGLATELRVFYEDRRGLLRDVLVACTALRFAIERVWIERGQEGQIDLSDQERLEAFLPPDRLVALRLLVRGKRPISHLIARLSAMDGVVEAGIAEAPGLD